MEVYGSKEGNIVHLVCNARTHTTSITKTKLLDFEEAANRISLVQERGEEKRNCIAVL